MTEAAEVFSHEVMIPRRVLKPEETILMIEHASRVLLESNTATEAFVLLAQMEKLITAVKETLKEKAIAKLNGKEEVVLGATVALRRSVSWDYNSPTLARLDIEIKERQEKMKAHKRALESGATIVDPVSGEIETATKTKDGVTIAVTLPK